MTWDRERSQRALYEIGPAEVSTYIARDMTHLQDDYDRYLLDVRRLCAEEFWDIFLTMHKFSGRAIDAALRSVRLHLLYLMILFA